LRYFPSIFLEGLAKTAEDMMIAVSRLRFGLEAPADYEIIVKYLSRMFGNMRVKKIAIN
jgi:hypothetical protein